MTDEISETLRQLEDKLDTLQEQTDCDPMALSELDGFLAALAICPATIPPEEWAGRIWNDEEGNPPVFKPGQAEAIIELALLHHGDIVRQLTEKTYLPLLEIDPEDESLLWQVWLAGFLQAQSLRPEAWEPFFDMEDEETSTATAGLTMLATMAFGEMEDMDEDMEELEEMAPDVLPVWIDTLYEASKRLKSGEDAGERVGKPH